MFLNVSSFEICIWDKTNYSFLKTTNFKCCLYFNFLCFEISILCSNIPLLLFFLLLPFGLDFWSLFLQDGLNYFNNLIIFIALLWFRNVLNFKRKTHARQFTSHIWYGEETACSKIKCYQAQGKICFHVQQKPEETENLSTPNICKSDPEVILQFLTVYSSQNPLNLTLGVLMMLSIKNRLHNSAKGWSLSCFWNSFFMGRVNGHWLYKE